MMHCAQVISMCAANKDKLKRSGTVKYNRMKPGLVVLIVITMLMGCTAREALVKHSPVPLKTLTAMGYGTAIDKQLMPAQRRLMGMRASKMEAYRDMAEQIYGVNLNGRTTVEHMVVKNDDYRSFIDTIVRGARIKSIKAIDVDIYETIMEVDLTAHFFDCVKGSIAVVNECIRASQGFSVSAVAVDRNAQAIRPVSVECNTDDCRQYPEVHGFTRQMPRLNYLVEMMEETSKQLVSTPVQLYDVMFGGKVGDTF